MGYMRSSGGKYILVGAEKKKVYDTKRDKNKNAKILAIFRGFIFFQIL
jgi:hypothetical protein